MAQVTINATSGNSTGKVRNQDSSFSTARNGTTGSLAFPADANSTARSGLSGGTYFIERGFYKFSLASLPQGSRIFSLDLKLYLTNITNNDTQTLHIVESTASDSLVTTDFDNISFSSLGSVLVSGVTPNQYTTITLSASAITLANTKVGTDLKFSNILSSDLNNSAPSGENEILPNSGSGSNPPQLIVGYTPPGGAALFSAL